MHLRLHPIRVLCFHQVSDTFDESTMQRCDWMQTDVFKRIICNMREHGYVFISLPEAREKLRRNVFRFKKYAVLTADDGWASLRNILPWLNEQQIPVTLFLNPGYLDGKHYREKQTEKYLTEKDVNLFYSSYPLLTIGMHGWTHTNALYQTKQEFEEGVTRSMDYLCKFPNYIPYYAYTWGKHTRESDEVLKEKNLCPVYVYGNLNYNNSSYIFREILDKDFNCK